jgi:beta-glucosidase
MRDVVEQMTLEEKVAVVSGADLWHNHGVERLGVPAIKVSDGPNGARGASFSGPSSVCFPCGTALAATWNTDLVQRVGEVLGKETRRKGARVLLAPTVNIHRSPLAGRNFECYSEDPYLSARMAVAYINGVQSQGVGTSVKHFVCNDSEFERHTISSEVSERALREIYLVPFHAAITEAGSWVIMSAYNKINGTWAAEHPTLLTDILKREWGFDGFVISDWFGTQSTVPSANAGLDLEMPGRVAHWGDKLVDAVKNGEVPESVLDDKVERLLRIAQRSGAFDEPEQAEQSVDDAAERALVRQAAGEAIVLLKNDNGVLPLNATTAQSIAVIGPNGDIAQIQGGGSAGVTPHYSITPLDGIRQRTKGNVDFERGCVITKNTPVLDERHLRATIEYFGNRDFNGEPIISETLRRAHQVWMGKARQEIEPGQFSVRVRGTFTPQDSGTHRLTLTSAGLSRLLLDGEVVVDNWTEQTRGSSFYGGGSTEVGADIELDAGKDYGFDVEFQPRQRSNIAGFTIGCLPPVPDDLMERAEALAARSDVAVVVVGNTAEWETEGVDRFDMHLPLKQDELIERVSAANPNTIVVVNAGSPVAMDWADRVPAIVQVWYPGQECGNAIADVLFGDVNPSGRLPTTFPARWEDNPARDNYPGSDGKVFYEEDIFVGYRHYDAKKIEPKFCFGHGLSYTTFEWGDVRVDGDTISVDVTNTGPVAGQEVVQVYVADREASVPRPEKELKGFAKVALEPGETKSVDVTLDANAFAFWHPDRHAWTVEPGEFDILAGPSSRDIRARTTVTR